MPRLLNHPAEVEAAGNLPKKIFEHVGHASTGHGEVSIARMDSPVGWVEPFQTPTFLEVSVVLRGTLVVESSEGSLRVKTGEIVICEPGERVRYSTPDGASYLAICCPAFSPDTVNRES